MSDLIDNEHLINSILLKYIKCTQCSEFCFSPILQCENGHNFCTRCQNRVQICILCLTPLTDVRNRVAEKLSHIMKLSCGCQAIFYQGSATEHIRTCRFAVHCQLRNYETADETLSYNTCSWLGSPTELYEHVNMTHSGSVMNSAAVTHKFPIGVRTNAILVQCFDRQFWSYLYYDWETYTMRGMVFVFGVEEDAKRFGFEYEVVRRDCPNVLVILGDVVCMRGLEPDLKEYFDAGKPSEVLFEGRESFNQMHDRGFVEIKMKIVKHHL